MRFQSSSNSIYNSKLHLLLQETNWLQHNQRVLNIIWQNVSISGHPKHSSIKYIKRIVSNCITFWIHISTLQFNKIHICCVTSITYMTRLKGRNGLTTFTTFLNCTVVFWRTRIWNAGWYCRDRVSSCNIYAVQQDTQSFLMIEFYSPRMLARHVSDVTAVGSCRQSSSYNWVTAGRVQQYAYYHIPNLHIQLVQNAPDDGPVRSETCRANICDE